MRPPLKIGSHGQITYRKRNNRWEARARTRTITGEYVRKYASARTKTEATEILMERLEAVTPPATLTKDSRLDALSGQWRETMLVKGLAPRTVDRYEWTLEKHIDHYIGSLPIGEMTTSRAQKYLTMLHEKHGPGVARGARTVLLQMFSYAVQDDVITRNPIRDTSLQKAKRKTVESFTPEQIPELREHLTGDVRDVFDLMLGTGLRISEVLALQWKDFDDAQARIRVTGAVKRTKREGLHRGEPKSMGSKQWLYLPGFAVDTLRGRERFCDLIFSTSTGNLWEPTSYRRMWRRQLADTPFAGSHPHMVRSTVATILAASEGALAASRQLGHSSESITVKHYISRPDSAPDLTSVLEKLL